MIFVTLIVFCLWYVFFSFVHQPLALIIRRRVCAMCFSGVATILSLFFIDYIGFTVPNIIIALLFVQSGVGVSYLVDEYNTLHKKKLQYDIARLSIISASVFAAYIFSTNSVFLGLLLMLPILVFGFIALTPVRKVAAHAEKEEKNAQMIKEKLKNCC